MKQINVEKTDKMWKKTDKMWKATDKRGRKMRKETESMWKETKYGKKQTKCGKKVKKWKGTERNMEINRQTNCSPNIEVVKTQRAAVSGEG